MKPTEIEMATNGEFLREYGKQYFIVCSEALNIGRVKWEMVPIGKSGKDAVSFYMTTEKMYDLCADILSGAFKKKVEADTGNYPSAYKYQTGTNGALKLNIGGARVGCRIQMQNPTTNANYTMAVALESMTVMARKYMLCTGMVPVAAGSYYEAVMTAFEKGRHNNKRNNKVADEYLEETTESIDTEDSAPAAPAEKSAAKASKPAKADTPAETRDFAIAVKGIKVLKDGYYAYTGTDVETKEAVELLFPVNVANKLSWFPKFEDAAALAETNLKISGEKKGRYVLYKGAAKTK